MTANPQIFSVSSAPISLQLTFPHSSRAELPQLDLTKAYLFSRSPSNDSAQTSSSPQHPWTSPSPSEAIFGLPRNLKTSYLEDVSDSFFDIQDRSIEEPMSSPSFSLSVLEEDLSNPSNTKYDEMIKDFVLSGINSSSKTILKKPLCQKPEKRKRQTWKPEEDMLVLKLIEKYGQKWGVISKMMMGNRNEKQIRDRYMNVLMPEIKKSAWTEQEDALVLSLYEKSGSKWRQIAEELQGRTEAQVKNRFQTHLKGRYVKHVVKGEQQRKGKEVEVLGQTQRNVEKKIVQIEAYNVLNMTPSTCFESPTSGSEGKGIDFVDMMFSFQ